MQESGRQVVVVGAGGHAKVVISTLQAQGDQVAGVYDDNPAKAGTAVLGIPVLGTVQELAERGAVAGVIAVGSNAARRHLADRLPNVTWVTAIHPSATVHASVRVGAGTVIFAGAVVQPDTTIGRHAIINTGATVDHDCSLGDFVHVAPGCHLAGTVTLHEGAFLGIASSAIPGVQVGAWSTVGAGGVVVRDLPPHITAVGAPARPVN